MSKKMRNIVTTIVLCVAGLALIGYGTFLLVGRNSDDEVVPVVPAFTDTDVDYYGNTWKLEAYNDEYGKYVMLEIYMEEDHDMKWYGSVASGSAEINYIIYQDDHYAISVNPKLDEGSSELGFMFDKLEPDHNETASYLYYSLSIDTSGEDVAYRVIGGELTDTVTDVHNHEQESEVESEPESESDGTDVESDDTVALVPVK